jgi:hypothetical protein
MRLTLQLFKNNTAQIELPLFALSYAEASVGYDYD